MRTKNIAYNFSGANFEIYLKMSKEKKKIKMGDVSDYGRIRKYKFMSLYRSNYQNYKTSQSPMFWNSGK